jgi:hypothetical protein
MVATFCATANTTVTATWESTIGSGVPANTVALIRLTFGVLLTTDAYVVRNGTNDYDLVIPNFPDSLICDGAGSFTLTIYGSVPGSSPARRITQNPSSTGTYTATILLVDSTGVTHTSSNSVIIV